MPAASMAAAAAKSGVLKKLIGALAGVAVLIVCGSLAVVLFIGQSFSLWHKEQETSEPELTAEEIPGDLVETLIAAAATCSSFDDPGFLAAYINRVTRWDRDYENGSREGISALTLDQWNEFGPLDMLDPVTPSADPDPYDGLNDLTADLGREENDTSDQPAMPEDERKDPHLSIYALANLMCDTAKEIRAEKKGLDEGQLAGWMAYALLAPMDEVLEAETWPTDPEDSRSEDIAMILSQRNVYGCRLDPEKCVASATCQDLPVGEPYRPAGVSLYGGYQNGQIPASLLTPIRTNQYQLLHPCAEAQFALLNTAYKAEFGKDIPISDSYRSYAQQVKTKAEKGWLAADAGTSNHGWGLALDLGTGTYGTTGYQWMMANAPQYGWHNPPWALEFSSSAYAKPEPWHWEFFNDALVVAPDLSISPSSSTTQQPK